ncbi:MAG TPA: hypothetical protein VJN48_11310 [Terriglobales bacterium]|nr:hypothetical protein [Terriglobales bacterium]
MSLFRTDSVALSYSNIEEAKRWWISAFDCKQVKVPPDWDNQLPSDVALKMAGDSEPTILLSNRAEVTQAGFDRSASTVPVIFSDKLKKAYEHLTRRGVLAGPIQSDGETEFFEVRDSEGNVIEICKEP